MTDILIQQNNEALVPPEFPTNVHEQAPVLIQENILQDGGIAATVDVASTTTLDPDTPAYVNNIGDEKHAVLQFGIPKGETGEAGVDGVDGQAATIVVGSTTTVAPDQAASVVNTGTSQNAVLNFSIPQGVQGVQGEQGYSPEAYVEQTATGALIHINDSSTETTAEVFNGQDGADGQAATVSVGSTTTGAAGTNASVVNSGTSSAAVLDFTIPRGADGAAGRDGTDGVSPTATVSQTSSGATITITDAQGTTTANISNGVDGTDGTDGSDGFSPIATVSQTATGATISITDAQGTTTANITNGVDGTDGTDGITPSITATASVDNTTGTPSVSVSKTGTDANPNFAFAFEHLKGETGTLPTYSYSLNQTYTIGTDGSDTVYRTIIGSDSFAVDTSKWMQLGNIFGSGSGQVKTILKMEFVLRDSGNNYWFSGAYDGGTLTSTINPRQLLARVSKTGDVQIGCYGTNFGSAKVRVIVEYTKV